MKNEAKKSSSIVDGDSLLVIWTTVANIDDASQLAQQLLQQRFAACVQIEGPLTSHYVWQGEPQSEAEYRVVAKTTRAVADAAVEFLSDHHPYSEPQIIVLPVARSTAGYRQWVVDQTGSTTK